jgi:tetratricopeptide (TPR) repeat protein
LLYKYYSAEAEDLPDTLAGMGPLFDALSHGCKAGLAQEAFDEVFMRRILRGQDLYAPRKVGGFSAQLSAMSHFFERGDWKRPLPELSSPSQAFIVKQWAEILRGLNRAEEAHEAYTSAVERLRRLGDLQTASHAAIRQSELLLTQARLSAAHEAGRVGLELAEELFQSGTNQERYIQALANMGAVLHARGEIDRARELLRQAEQLLERVAITNPDFTAYLYWCLLLDLGEADKVRIKAERMLARARVDAQPPSMMNFACDHIAIARAIMLQARRAPDARDWSADLGTARDYLDEAVRLIRNSGHFFNLPWALLPRAEFRHCFTDLSGTEAGPLPDLDETFEITSRGRWIIHECAARLLHARILLERALFSSDDQTEAFGKAIEDGRVALDRADQIVNGKSPSQDGAKDGCRRYRVDVLYANVLLLLVENRLAASRGDATQAKGFGAAAQEKVQQARTIVDKTHYHILTPNLDRVSWLLGRTGDL